MRYQSFLVRNKISANRLLATLTETFGLSRAAAFSAVLLVSLVMFSGAFWFFHSAPSDTIVITSGPEGSIFQSIAMKYRDVLARHRVKLKILPSEGSLENLQRLDDPSVRVDVGFVQSGITNAMKGGKPVSLGSISYEPLLVFYRSATPVDLLSELNGKRIAIGRVGSGTRSLALALLGANGIEPGGATPLMDLGAEDATKALLDGSVDAIFVTGDSASSQTMRKLLRTPEIQLFNFAQADGYTRRIHYLNKLELPKGSIDLGKNIPAQDVYLVGPTVELLARPNLHPALSDLLLDAAREVHGRATIFQRRGEFPAPLEYDFHLSADASRYYKTGKSFLYRYLPFWLASQVNRILLVIVPLVVLIPGLRSIPAIYRWQIRLRIYRWYRALLALESDLFAQAAPESREKLLSRLDDIENAVNRMKVPASFADQFYGLRGHISFVRNRLMDRSPSA
jgi:TRAP-type uncharacterized transport system substrate-binding protein